MLKEVQEVDIGDVIVVGLVYLNWLEKDASEAFEKALEKHEMAIKQFVAERSKQ